jgi:hypothetical protein
VTSTNPGTHCGYGPSAHHPPTAFLSLLTRAHLEKNWTGLRDHPVRNLLLGPLQFMKKLPFGAEAEGDLVPQVLGDICTLWVPLEAR